MFKKLLQASLLMLSVSACATNGRVTDTGCVWAKPIYIARAEADTLTAETARQILEHNLTYKAICRSK